MADELDIAVRAYTGPTRPPITPASAKKTKKKRGSVTTDRFPEHVLIFDTETTVDPTQALNFGAWRYCRVRHAAGGVELVCVQEGIFYADDLPERAPQAMVVLRDYVDTHRGDVDTSELDASPVLLLQSQSVFLERVFWRVAFRLRGAVVAFNFPFDLSRVAWQVGATRNRRPDQRDAFEGGFSFALFSYVRDGTRHESRHRPRVAIKAIDSKRALKGFRSPEKLDSDDLIPDDADGRPDPKFRFRGHLMDLRTLVFALTDRSHSLESACNAFGVGYTKRDVVHGQITTDYVTYCREDVDASQQLTQAAVTEFLRHPIELQATRAYSPATIGKGYLKQMGVPAPAMHHAIDPRILGWAMSDYYGGRAECRIRRTPVPVVYVDFKSMYPTACALMGIWDLLTASTIHATDSTDAIQRLLDTIDADSCFEPTVWTQFVAIAQIIPTGEILPVRARYGAGPSWQIGVNPLTSQQPMWFTIPDLIAAKILTGRTPQIIRAISIQGHGTLPGLRPVKLLGETLVDPGERDFFRTVIEQRTLAQQAGDEGRSKGLKTLANATSYGIYAQMTRRELGPNCRETVTVYGHHDQPFKRSVANPEEPGEYAFPPVAAAITGAARLLLALTEHEVNTRGGTYAFCDTDSMAIVANRHGDLIACNGGAHALPDGRDAIRALTWDQVEEIRDRFGALNPYDAAIVPGSILELEDENYTHDTRTSRRQLWCFAISAKRYTFLTDPPNDL